ncbi:DUF6264 family protein [Frondihabitans australicus]|uniref:Uncharacterized protein n=1 Tax=Frondihabitans australicus TaxID=386892 RepID=A0A495II49_9MICO|nr:DUF6264 family protein [Frondihabitans australicus]RKR74981.1 hypothetical protein C8E83_2115 [Frondihabitans australicus]
MTDAERQKHDAPRWGERVPDRVEGTPAPGYGEYAPPGWVSPVRPPADPAPESLPGAEFAVPASPVTTDLRRPDQQTRSGQQPRSGEQPRFDAPPPTGRPVPGAPPAPYRYRPFNRPATFMLLGLGLYMVVSAVLSVKTFAASQLSLFTSLGYPVTHFTNSDGLSVVGYVAAIGGMAVFLVVAIWSIRRLTRGLNAWAPLLIVGLAFRFATAIAVTAVLLTDPAVARAITGG